MTKQTFILITALVAAGVAISGIGAYVGDHLMSVVGAGIAAVGAIAWFAKAVKRKAKLKRAGDRAAGGFMAFTIGFLALGLSAENFLDGVTSTWVGVFGLCMAILTTVLFAIYAANSETVVDIEATAKEQRAQNLRTRFAEKQNHESADAPDSDEQGDADPRHS